MASKEILLIEDDAELAEMYQLQLTKFGYRVRVVSNAHLAVGQLEASKVDLIILDLLLPGQNGLSVLHELRSYEDWRQLPVIILSNVSASELGVRRATLQGLGVLTYLEKAKTKPIALHAAVKSALKS